ncbi:MAG TPA: hypothetical protein VMW16_03235 [Sedimentisphaerales bacterium]|nr:hypothetical protein [Sedimentisphaerales bacterium]
MSRDAFKDTCFKITIGILIALLGYCGCEIKADINDISERLRKLELQQVKICVKLGIDPICARAQLGIDPICAEQRQGKEPGQLAQVGFQSSSSPENLR